MAGTLASPASVSDAECRRRQGLAGPRHPQQPMTRKAVGEHAGGHPDEEERDRAHGHRHPDEERRVRQLEGQPAEHDVLAHHPHGVQGHRDPETAEVRDAQERQRRDDHGCVGAGPDDGPRTRFPCQAGRSSSAPALRAIRDGARRLLCLRLRTDLRRRYRDGPIGDPSHFPSPPSSRRSWSSPASHPPRRRPRAR